MKRKRKTFYLVVTAFLVLFFVGIVLMCVELHSIGDLAEGCKQYSPSVQINTKWVCQERKLYFISDKDGCIMGVYEAVNEPVYFRADFSLDSCSFYRLDSMSYSEYASKHELLISGVPEYGKKKLLLRLNTNELLPPLNTSNDVETLSFIRVGLAEDFKFDG